MKLDQTIDRLAGTLPALELALEAVARPVADLEEVELAGDAAQHDPADGPDARRVLLVQRQRADLLDGQKIIEASAPGIEAQLLDPAQLLVSTDPEGIWWLGHGFFP